MDFSFEAKDIDQQDIAAAFQRFGIIHIKSVLSKANIDYFHSIISSALKSALRQNRISIPFTENDIDYLYNRLFQASGVSDFWRFLPKTFAKNSLIFHRLLCEPCILKVAERLIGHDQFQLNWDQNIFRVDRPDEEYSGFEWHQDHPYILLSESAVSVWAPLTEVTRSMGPLIFVPKSHNGPFHRVILKNKVANTADDYKSKTSKHRYMDMANRANLAEEFERESIQLLISAGDALFFHSHLVHKSGQNLSDRSRWVFVARYGDLLDKDAIERGWRTTRGANPSLVKELYPDRVVGTHVRE